MSKSEKLKSELRAKVGSRHARKLREQGRIPASLQADDKHPHVDFHIEEHNFLATRRAERASRAARGPSGPGSPR